MPDHVYERDADVFVPTEWAASPWSQRNQHGGPVNALFAVAADELREQICLTQCRLFPIGALAANGVLQFL